MDPDTVLANIRSLIAEWDKWYPDASMCKVIGDDLAYAVNNLDTWLSSGGFPPQAWRDAGHTPVS